MMLQKRIDEVLRACVSRTCSRPRRTCASGSGSPCCRTDDRDALDDRTSAEVAAAYTAALEDDPRIAVDRRDLADRQFNERLLAYREALQGKGGPLSSADRIGRCLLAFASDGARTAGTPLAYAIELLERYAEEASAALRDAYGEAKLPEDVKPSVVRR
jgi:hypothetical protein